MAKIGLIDYGMGNLHSVKKAVENLGEEIIIINKNYQISDCKALILPGVGAFDPAIENLRKTGLINDLKDWIDSGKSFLGICLGLQLLFDSSDEGLIKGLGLVKGKIKKIPNVDNQKIPHIGWCNLIPTKKSTLLRIDELENWTYFVHSYYAEPENYGLVTANVSYGNYKLTAIIENENLIACQFHPEKSGKTGELLLKRWLKSIN